MVTKDKTNSPKVEVGEIDTRAPFQSVKDAVNLFGEGAFSGEKPAIKKIKPHSAERVLAKETKLHIAEKELNKLKEQLKNAESTKSEALLELERAKRTLEELTNKLQTVNEAKDSAIEATETIKNQADQLDNGVWKHDLENTKEQYTAVVTELNAAKQELRKLHQDHEAAMEGKAGALRLAMEAGVTKKVNSDRAGELSKEITSVQEAIEQVKLATIEAQQEQAKIYSEKNVQKLSHKAALEEAAKKLLVLRKEVDPELSKDLETQLAETTFEIKKLQKEMEDARASDLDSLKNVTLELDEAKGSLQKVAEEESSLKRLLESLKTELENVRKEKAELEEKEAETEAVAGKLHAELRKRKSELEAARSEEMKFQGVSDDMVSSLEQLSLESENAKRESEEMKEEAERLKKEAEAMGVALEEAEKKLSVAVKEAEEAKAAEAKALEEIKVVSERADVARASVSERIMMSREEYESLSRKVEESEKLAEMRVEAAMAQVEAVRASEHETLKRLEAAEIEIGEMKAATEAAVKKAEMAEAAKKAVEGELRRWREREQKKAAEAASRILQETQQMTPIHVQNSPQKAVNVQHFEKSRSKSKHSTKKVLVSNLSGIFQRKKSQIDGGSSPSYLPGEKY